MCAWTFEETTHHACTCPARLDYSLATEMKTISWGWS